MDLESRRAWLGLILRQMISHLEIDSSLSWGLLRGATQYSIESIFLQALWPLQRGCIVRNFFHWKDKGTGAPQLGLKVLGTLAHCLLGLWPKVHWLKPILQLQEFYRTAMARASPYSRWDPVCWRIGKVTVSNYDRMFMATRIFLCQNTIFWMGWNLQILGWFLFRSSCQPVALKTQQKKRLLITSTDWISSPVAIWLVAVCVKSVVMMRTADNWLQ